MSGVVYGVITSEVMVIETRSREKRNKIKGFYSLFCTS